MVFRVTLFEPGSRRDSIPSFLADFALGRLVYECETRIGASRSELARSDRLAAEDFRRPLGPEPRVATLLELRDETDASPNVRWAVVRSIRLRRRNHCRHAVV